MHSSLFLTFFYAGLTTKGERKTSTRFIEESLSISRKGLSSLDLSGVETREEMKHNPININELIIYKDIVPKEIMVEVITPVEMKVGRNCSLLARGQAKLTPPEVIMGATAHFNRKRVSTLMETCNVASVVDAFFILAIPLPHP
jgi:hypothetical protein